MNADAEGKWNPLKRIGDALERGNLLKRIAVCRQDDRQRRIAYVSDLRRCHGDGNDRLKRLVDEDGLVKRIVDPCEKKAQAEVNGEALCVMKDLDVEGGSRSWRSDIWGSDIWRIPTATGCGSLT